MSRPGRDSRASRRSIARRERVRDRAIGVAGRSGPSVTVSKVRRAGHESRHERAPTSDRTVECVSLCSTLSRSAAAPRSGGVAWVPCPHHRWSARLSIQCGRPGPLRARPTRPSVVSSYVYTSTTPVAARCRLAGSTPPPPRVCNAIYRPTSSTVRLKHRHNTNNSQYTSYVRRR
jgi:hypothetical protein